MVHGNYEEITTDDVYVINEQTLQVFYVRGVEYEGRTYYTKDVENPPILNPIEITRNDINPTLYTGMIPVVWNDSKGDWVEVKNPDPDTSDNINTYDRWYDYANGMYANVKLQDGSMYVWIPTSQEEGFWVAKYEASNNGDGEVKVIQGATIWNETRDGNINSKCKNIASLPSSGLESSEVQTYLITETNQINAVGNYISTTNYAVMQGTSNTPITANYDLGSRPIIIGNASGFAKVIPTPSAWEDEIKETREGNIPIPNGYYYVGGKGSTLLISDNPSNENIGTDNVEGKTYKWITDKDEYINSDINLSVSKYGGYFVDSRYNDSLFDEEDEYNVKKSEETYLDKVTGDIAVCRRTGIWNAQDLSCFRDDVNGGDTFEDITVYVMDDVDLSTVCSESTGRSWVPIGHVTNSESVYFAGIFDGKYHTISNLYINANDGVHVGLFKTHKGTIQKVKLDSCYIRNYYSSSTINIYAGGICSYNQGIITECGVDSGQIIIERTSSNPNASSNTGGIAGGNPGEISKCYNRATISAIANKNTSTNQAYAGGIAGRSENVIVACYNTGSVSATGYQVACGGIAGISIKETSGANYCYNIGTLSGTNGSGYKHLGGITGNLGNSSYAAGTVTNSYSTIATLYYYYTSSWKTKTSTAYAATNFTSITSVPGVALVGTGYYKEDINNINEGYLILDWED